MHNANRVPRVHFWDTHVSQALTSLSWSWSVTNAFGFKPLKWVPYFQSFLLSVVTGSQKDGREGDWQLTRLSWRWKTKRKGWINCSYANFSFFSWIARKQNHHILTYLWAKLSLAHSGSLSCSLWLILVRSVTATLVHSGSIWLSRVIFPFAHYGLSVAGGLGSTWNVRIIVKGGSWRVRC